MDMFSLYPLLFNVLFIFNYSQVLIWFFTFSSRGRASMDAQSWSYILRFIWRGFPINYSTHKLVCKNNSQIQLARFEYDIFLEYNHKSLFLFLRVFLVFVLYILRREWYRFSTLWILFYLDFVSERKVENFYLKTLFTCGFLVRS